MQISFSCTENSIFSMRHGDSGLPGRRIFQDLDVEADQLNPLPARVEDVHLVSSLDRSLREGGAWGSFSRRSISRRSLRSPRRLDPHPAVLTEVDDDLAVAVRP